MKGVGELVELALLKIQLKDVKDGGRCIIKCGHTGDLQQLPELEMEQKCPHTYFCPLCGFTWDCTAPGCHANLEEHPGEFNAKFRSELESILDDDGE